MKILRNLILFVALFAWIISQESGTILKHSKRLSMLKDAVNQGLNQKKSVLAH